MYLSVPNVADKFNCYVANMTHHHHLDDTWEGSIMLYNLPAEDGTFRALTAITASETQELAVPAEVDAFFGRSIKVTSSDAGDLTIHGHDYLGQPMSENITCTAGTVETAKAFKTVSKLVAAADLAGNLTLKYGGEVGLPFVTRAILAEYDGNTSQSLGTLTAADAADPADADDGDPRGTYAIATTANGVKDILIVARFNPDAAGGLYGVPQG